MSRGQFRPVPYAVVFTGQSLNNHPAAPDNYPTQMMDGFLIDGYPVSWANVAIDGASWTQLSGANPQAHLVRQANRGAVTILAMCGGTGDILAGDSGATIYADMVSYADNARVSGYDLVVAQTITPATSFTGGQETARAAANVLILADADQAFNAVADVAVAPLDDPADTDYYSDGIHPTALGASVLADVTLAAVESLL